MKVEYKGHEITVTCEESLAGYEMNFYSIFRTSDGFECDSGYEDSDSTLDDLVETLKCRIDIELKSSDPWGENGPRNPWRL